MGLDVSQFKNLESEIKQQQSLLLRMFNFRELFNSSDFWTNYFGILEHQLDDAKEQLKTENIRIQTLDGNTPEAKTASAIWLEQHKIYTACKRAFNFMTTVFEATFVHEAIFKKLKQNNNKNLLDHYCQQELSPNNRSNFDNIPAWKTQVAKVIKKLASAENKLNILNDQIDILTSNARTKEDHKEVLEQREMYNKLAISNSQSSSALATMEQWIEYKLKPIQSHNNGGRQNKPRKGLGR